MRYSRLHYRLEIANWVLGMSAGAIYLVNLFLHLFLWESTALAVLTELVWPLLLAFVVYEWDWRTNILSDVTMDPSKKPLPATILLVFMTMLLTSSFHGEDEIALIPTILPLMAVARIGYIWGSRSAYGLCAILCAGVAFLLQAALLPFNTAGVLMLLIGVPVLLFSYPLLSRLYSNAVSHEDSLACSMVFAACAVGILMFPGAQENLKLSFYGRPSLWNSTGINDCCREILLAAPLVGSTEGVSIPLGFAESGREYAVILAAFGQMPWLLVVIVALLMISSAIYRAYHEFGRQKLCVVANTVLLCVQTIAMLLAAVGVDVFRFPLEAPLLGDDTANSFYLLAVACILKPKQKHLAEVMTW